jgi:activator of HSP90 ATPase
LVQKWRFSTWPEDIVSTVTILLEEKDGKTTLNLTHEGIPEDDQEHTEQGWKNNFWLRIRGIFGYGSLK